MLEQFFESSLTDFRVMDSSESQHVLFHSVANCYVIKPNESIACQYAVLPSVTQSCQDYVGIFKVGSKHTRDCLVLSWPPEDHSNESDVKHSCVLFDGAKIISALTTDSISWGTYYQFCYVDASNCIQGRSRPFQLESDSEPNTGIQLPSLENFTFLGCNDDFVEVGEEEDGEIVVIKPRSAFLMEELHRITSSANDKALETARLHSENDNLTLQLNKLQEVYSKVLQDRDSLVKRLEESHQRHAEEVARLQAENNRLSQQLLQKTEKCKRLENEISELKQCAASQESSQCGAAEVVDVGIVAGDALFPRHTSDESGPSAAVCPPDAVLCHDCNSASSVVRHVPRSLALLPDVANTCGRAAASPGVVAGSPPRTGSPMTVRSPNQTIQMLSRFGEAARGVGLNIISHLPDMNLFAPDLGDSAEEISSVAKPPPCGSTPDCAASCSRFEQLANPCILRPPVSGDRSASAESFTRIICPFCPYIIYPTSNTSVQQRLVDHISVEHCRETAGS